MAARAVFGAAIGALIAGGVALGFVGGNRNFRAHGQIIDDGRDGFRVGIGDAGRWLFAFGHGRLRLRRGVARGLRGRLLGRSGRAGNNFRDLVFFDEDIAVVGFDFEHVVFVGHDHAVKLFAVLQANFIGAARRGEDAQGEQSEQGCKDPEMAGSTHGESMRLANGSRNT